MSWLTRADETRLLAIARRSIDHGLRHGRPLDVERTRESAALSAPGACFVTLRRADGTLRGCVGSFEPERPLLRDVAENAYGAAFRDPRFEPLGEVELGDVRISISLVGPFEPIQARSAEELVARLRPGTDGLVLRQGPRRATFLPAVWEQLPEPRAFVCALEQKAGITSWQPPVEAFRYETTTLDDR